MTQKQMIEFIKEHHPNESDAKIRLLLQAASDDFLAKTLILQGAKEGATSSETDYLNIIDSIIKIDRLEIKGSDDEYYELPRIAGIPLKTKEMTK